MSTRTLSSAVLASAVAAALASMAAAAPMTEAEAKAAMDAGMEKCYGVALAGRTTAPPGRAPPARAPRRSTTRATPGSSWTAAPAPPWSCRTAAWARPRRSTATFRLSRARAGERRRG